MKLITLAEAKDRLSLDFDYKDNEIESRVDSIEGYLSIATGLDLARLRAELDKNNSNDVDLLPDDPPNENLLDVAADAREYVLLRLYLDYYAVHTEIDDRRLNFIINQLKVAALLC